MRVAQKVPIDLQKQLWQESTNVRLFVLEIGWFGLAIPAVGSFLSVFMILLHASPLALGLLSSLPAVFLLLSSFAGEWWNRRHDNTVRALRWPALLQRFRTLLLVFVPFLPEEWRVPAIVAIMSLLAIPMGISNIIFLVMLRETVSDDRLILVISRRQLAFNLCVAASTLAMGFWLEHVPFPLNYQVMFAFSFAVMLVSYGMVMRLKVLYPEPPETEIRRPINFDAWREPGFRQLVLLIALLFVAYFSILPVIPLRLVEDLGANEGFISVYSFLELMGAATMAYFASRLVSRFGHRNMILLGMTGTALGAIILAGAPSLHLTLPAALITGSTWVATDISQFSFLSLNIPPKRKASYTTAYMQATAIAIFIGPLIGSTLADSGVDLRHVLLLGAGMRWLAGLFMRFNRIEPIPAPSGPSSAPSAGV